MSYHWRFKPFCTELFSQNDIIRKRIYVPSSKGSATPARSRKKSDVVLYFVNFLFAHFWFAHSEGPCCIFFFPPGSRMSFSLSPPLFTVHCSHSCKRPRCLFFHCWMLYLLIFPFFGEKMRGVSSPWAAGLGLQLGQPRKFSLENGIFRPRHVKIKGKVALQTIWLHAGLWRMGNPTAVGYRHSKSSKEMKNVPSLAQQKWEKSKKILPEWFEGLKVCHPSLCLATGVVQRPPSQVQSFGYDVTLAIFGHKIAKMVKAPIKMAENAEKNDESQDVLDVAVYPKYLKLT